MRLLIGSESTQLKARPPPKRGVPRGKLYRCLNIQLFVRIWWIVAGHILKLRTGLLLVETPLCLYKV